MVIYGHAIANLKSLQRKKEEKKHRLSYDVTTSIIRFDINTILFNLITTQHENKKNDHIALLLGMM